MWKRRGNVHEKNVETFREEFGIVSQENCKSLAKIVTKTNIKNFGIDR